MNFRIFNCRERNLRSLAAVLLGLAGGTSGRSAAATATVADATERRDAQALAAALAAKADLNGKQPDGMTALHWATFHDDLPLAERLLAAGAKAETVNRYGVTPLMLAALNGNAALAERLLAAGADVRARRPGGETVLMTAARTGRPEALRVLLARGADVEARDGSGQTALMWATAEGHAGAVEVLLAAGADFRRALDSGFTPLFFAVREGRPDVVRVLLKAGADVNGTMEPKRTGPRLPKKGTAPLHLAVENGHFELAAELLAAGANPNDQRSGYTALHMLSWVRKPERGDDGTPAPVGSGNLTSLELVRRLVAAGADVNARLERGPAGNGRLGRKGATPFLLAADTADLPLMQLLLELKADPFLANAEGATPLMAAVGLGTRAPTEEAGTEDEALAAAELVFRLGGKLDTVDANGETAMHGAAYASFPKLVRWLAAKGADIETWNRKNKRGWTPLLIAQGFRFGNFKPSAETIEALSEVMRAKGIEPPPPPPRDNTAKYEAP